METTETTFGLLAAWLAGVIVVAVVLGAAVTRMIASGRRMARALDQAVRARLATEQRLRLALGASSDVIWDWDVTTDALYCPGLAKAYGLREESAPRTAAAFMPLVHPEDAALVMGSLTDAIEGRRSAVEYEHRMLHGTGEWRWTLGRARVVERDARGKGTRLVGSCADITERRRMLHRLQLSDRLASLGTLAAGVAHEINNPLTYVLGNVQHALDLNRRLAGARTVGPDDLAQALAESTAALEDAAQGAERVRAIVRDLKVFSRADADDPRPIGVNRIVQSAANVAGPEIRRRARLRIALADVPTVEADESRLSQVFLNLLVNAAQAIPEGRPQENEVAVSSRVDAQGRVVVEVRDTGCGIAAGEQRRIFDPFFTTKPVGIGTGLGLAICHGIVVGAGGEIEVESSPGRGATFRIVLPASGLPEESASPSPERRCPVRARLLVVDDEEGFCRAAVRMLRGLHEVVSTTDPFDALRRVEKGEPFDVLLTDVVMPRLSGMELHTRVARCAPALASRTLFVTAGAVDSTTAAFLAARPGSVLEKPCGAAALREAVAAVLAAPEAPASPSPAELPAVEA